jgi:hypothetical protein
MQIIFVHNLFERKKDLGTGWNKNIVFTQMTTNAGEDAGKKKLHTLLVRI